MTYRPYFPLRGIIGGALLGLSIAVLLQQFAVVYPSRGVVLGAVLGAIVLDLLLANLVRASAARRSAAPATVAAPAAPVAVDTGFRATHRAPAGGLDAFEAPGATTSVARLDPGLDVVVLEQQGDWAHVRCSNGWETWVDARVLTSL